jgi:coenzyme F420 biosynthesis associated uncharacterized protein
MTTTPAAASSPAPFNRKIALAVSKAMTPRGPKATVEQAQDVVRQLKVLATVSAAEVHAITGLDAAAHLTSEVRVIDRPAWIQAATESFEHLGGDAFRSALAKSNPTTVAIGSAASGVQMGAILSLLSTKILGQFDPFAPSAAGQGTLLLVAPNIAAVREDLNVDQHDFSLWVCLHEQTHRVQFAAAPWLRPHLESRISELMTTVTAQAEDLSQDLANLVKTLELAKKNRADGVHPSELFLTPEARAVLSEITAVMSLLEGHANLVMDSVDSTLIPSVKTIRRRFNERPKNRTSIEKAILRWLGMDKKAAQYRDGQAFCTRVVESRGMPALNRAFERAEHLPTEAEIHAPDAWMARVLDSHHDSA